MNKPVSFELAKLLKEKGYNIPCLKCYLEDGSIQISSGDEGDCDEYNHNKWSNYSAPTIAEVIMWLYEKHGIWIYGKFQKRGVICFVIENTNGENITISPDYNSPTEAYEAAIYFTLNNLI